MKKSVWVALAIAVSIFGSHSCNERYRFRSNYRDVNSLLHDSVNLSKKPFLKAHTKDGSVVIFSDKWMVDTTLNVVIGNGTNYDFNRKVTYDGPINLSINEVVIFETNVKLREPERSRIAGLTILTGLDLLVTGLCVANPKACFGSCPTFYLSNNTGIHSASAEGFSNAISPSMEYTDIDALGQNNSCLDSLKITMKNEALETHCVKNVRVLAFPLSTGERVYHTPDDKFFLCENSYLVQTATGPEGDISGLLLAEDQCERLSFSSSDNMSSKEEIYLGFKIPVGSNLGLKISFRQTLMTTYLIYSALGYMGDEVGDIFTRMETDPMLKNNLEAGLKNELGEIDVYSWNETNKRWEFENKFYETGPIATNSQFIPLKIQSLSTDVKLKIVLNRGLWRIDYVGLTNIKKMVTPFELTPIEISTSSGPNMAALNAVHSTNRYLVSMPGEEYVFKFVIPEQARTNSDLFLLSRGYYLEWMREKWIKDKDLLKLRQMVQDPKAFLKSEAVNYKEYENTMEQVFWNSKVQQKIISNNRNEKGSSTFIDGQQ